MAQIYVKYNGRQDTLDFDDVFTPQRIEALGLRTPVSPSSLNAEIVRTAIAQKYDVNVSEFADQYIEINPNGNITIRPESGWGNV
jgi:hypothetical protein